MKVQNVGEECKKQGITEAWLLKPSDITVDFVNRKMALELRSYKKEMKYPTRHVLFGFCICVSSRPCLIWADCGSTLIEHLTRKIN